MQDAGHSGESTAGLADEFIWMVFLSTSHNSCQTSSSSQSILKGPVQKLCLKGKLDGTTVISSMGIEKNSERHHERAPSVLDEKTAHCAASPSMKRAVVAWLRSLISCSPSPSVWRPFHMRSRYEHSGYRYEQSHQDNIEAYLSTIRHHSTSQISVAKLSRTDSIEATSDLIDSIDTEDVFVKSLTTQNLYEPMPHNDFIRLLRVYKGALSDPVEVTLEFARLDDTIPEYEALSYVWGSSVTLSHIVHQTTQKAISITKNLYDALKGVQQPERDRVIWVDALCINQHDGKEKGIQVRKMNSIYARAARVLVWLGADDAGDADGAFSVLCSLANTQGESAHYETRSHAYVPFVPERVVDVEDYESWRKVMMFFCQTWYTRLWVLQEIVLAQDATFVWGDCSISWRYLGSAIKAIRSNELTQSLLQTRNLHNAFFMWHLSTVHHDSKRFQHSDHDQQLTKHGMFPFLHLLDIARSFEATDPRDKIYGLLGFPTLDKGLGAGSITPDYTLSASEIYTEVTHKLLEKEKNLNVLALVLYALPEPFQGKDLIAGLPSWVPNFHSKDIAFPISNTNTGHQYSTGLMRSMCLLPCLNRRILPLKGILLDITRATGPSIPFMESHKIARYLKPLMQWYAGAGISAPTLAATLTAGRNREGRFLSPRQKDDCIAALSREMRDFGLDTSSIPTERLDLNCNEGFDWKETIWRFITYRQPFVTEQGRFGLGPRGIKEGDAVAMLWGGQCPFVISEAGGGQWTLKGECFVEGWMDGDAVAALVREQKEDMLFEFV